MRLAHRAIAVGLCLLGACSSTGVGNPAPVSISLSIVNDSSDDAEDVTGAAGTNGSGSAGAAGASDAPPAQALPTSAIEDAIVVLGELRFRPCDAATGHPLAVPGPFVVDLKRGTTLPAIPSIAGTPGGYCGIDAPLAPASAPAALAGRSLFFDGTRADGAFFIVYANMTGTLRLRATPGASWSGAAEGTSFFWALRPRRWLALAELNGADAILDANRRRAIVIDADRHPALFLKIRARLAGLSALYTDADGDGQFTDSDRSGIVGLGLDNAD